jgi:ferric-dicitrate binding protein FerR (iron transport regulator)
MRLPFLNLRLLSVRLLILTCALLVGSRTGRTDERHSATVSFLDGSATNSSGGNGQPQPLALGGTVYENDLVETTPGSKMELKLQDGSVIRVGPASKMLLKSAYFGANGSEKKFTVKLFFGRVWSKVEGLVGGNSKFEVETDNAVAGVRGTTFRVDAKTDRSVLVRVYAGSVAVASPQVIQRQHGRGERHQVQGPTQVSRGEWEKIVGKQMQIAIGADGVPGEPQKFAAKDDAGDDWAAWNKALDEK